MIRYYKVQLSALLSLVLLLTTGCAGQVMNDSLNQYIDEKGGAYLSQAGRSAVCCVVGNREALYYKNIWSSKLDYYGERLPWSSVYWEGNRSSHWLVCSQSPEAAERYVNQDIEGQAYVLYCKNANTPKDRGYVYVEEARSKLKQYLDAKAAEQARVKRSQEEARFALVRQQRESTCKSFGFREATESFSKCMFELYKLEQQALMNAETLEQVRATQAANSAAQQQMLEQQRFMQGMQQLQNAADIVNPPKTTCNWNTLTHTMVCQ